MFFKAKLAAALQTIAALTVERDGFKASLDALGADPAAALATLTGERDSALALVTEHTGTIAALQGEIATLKGEAKTATEIGSQMALDIAANVSVPPVGTETRAGETGGDVLATYNAMTDGPERTAYFRKHKAALYDAQNRTR